MYGKLFAQMYDGSLVAHGPWQALVTFQQFIILADKEGVVDMTPTAIAGRTSIPLEIIQIGIAALELPDSDSRTPDEEGRRILRLSDTRSWGWQIVNIAHYRKIRSQEERREYQREWARTKRSTKTTKGRSRSTPVNNVDSRQTSTELTNSSKQYVVSSKQETTLTDSSESGPVPKNGRKPRPDTPKYPHFPTADSARFHQTCLTNGFVVDAGLLRKTLAPLYPVAGPIHPADSLDNALIAFLESRGSVSPDKARFWTIMQFAADIGRWVRLGAMPRQDPFSGAPTERGMLLAGDS